MKKLLLTLLIVGCISSPEKPEEKEVVRVRDCKEVHELEFCITGHKYHICGEETTWEGCTKRASMISNRVATCVQEIKVTEECGDWYTLE